MRFVIAWIVGILLAAECGAAEAMQFETADASATDVIIGGRGPIVHGDALRLEQALASVPATKRLVGLALGSPAAQLWMVPNLPG